MNLPGEAYLFNLSVLAVTVAVVSALVMLVRQTMGGKLSNFDVYLISAYVSLGFVIAVGAVLPPLVSLFEPSPRVMWAVASGLAAVFLAAVMVNLVAARRRASNAPISHALVFIFAMHWLAAALLAANAVVPQLQGTGLHAAALTVSMVMLMLAFVRRIASLLGDKPSDDWDPKRG